MKFKQLLFFLGVCIVLVTGCKEKSIQKKKYFKGDLFLVKETSLIDTLLGEKLVMEDPAFGMIAVYDSLMFFYHPRFTDFQYYCINLNSGKLHSKYFGKGKGPNEFINVSPILQYVTPEGEDVVSPFVAINEDQYGLFNVTKSILTKKTEIDTLLNLKWREDYFKPFMFVFSLPGTTVLAKESSNKRILKENRYTPPRYLTFNLEERRHKREYELYSEFNNKSIEDLNEAIHFSFDKLSPNRNKLAMAMVHLAQINILDLETGKLKGMRMSGTESFASLEEVSKPRDLKIYYKNIDVDEHNIYALYIENDTEGIDDYESSKSNVVQVFDWEGNYIRKLKLDRNIEHISVDSKNRLLYGVNNEDGMVYRYRLD